MLNLSASGKHLLFTHGEEFPVMRRYMKVKLESRYEELFRTFADSDSALEWCEDRLLEQSTVPRSLDRAVPHGDYELFAGLSSDEVSIVVSFLKRSVYQRGEAIIHLGDEARHLFFLSRGIVTVQLALPSGARKRLAIFSPGMTFGEMAVIDRAPRSAMIQADTEVECDLLSIADFTRLGQSHPAIKIKLLDNLNLGLCRKLRKANREISILE